MKALTLQQIKAPLELEERANLPPAAGEVVVQLKAAALNRRDYWITQGMYPDIKLPVVLGSDGAGVVVQVADGGDESWKGREVIINPGLDWGDVPSVQSEAFTILGLPRDGTFATQVTVPASQLFDRPQYMTWQESAALPLAGVTAYRALFSQGCLQAGETVLITGIGGGVATFALQFAIHAGAKVWVTSSSPRKIQHAVDLGAKGGFDYSVATWPKELLKLAGAPHLIIDSAGGSGYSTLVDLAGPGGRIVNYGATTGPPEKLDLFKVFWKQLCLKGSTMGSPDDFASMLQLVQKHQLRPIVDREFPWTEGNTALAEMKSSPQFGKIVLNIGD